MSWDKELENGLEDLLVGTGKAMLSIFSAFRLGLWQMRKRKNLIFLLLMTGVSAVLWRCWLASYWWLPIAVPILIICCFGFARLTEIEESRKAFLAVGFKGKDGKAPYLISSKELNGKTSAYYRSNIPLSTWQKSQELLQTALDCRIIELLPGDSKKVVRMISVSTDFKLPTMLPWKEDFMPPEESKIVLGESMSGPVTFDYNVTPHWILAGSTGSGKSVLLRSIVGQSLIKGHRVYLMDFKRGVEFGKAYDDFCEVILDKKRAVELLTWLVQENKRRLDLFRAGGFKDLRDYNKRHQDDPMDRTVVFIDELAILLIPTHDKGDKELTAQATDCLENIAILGRAAGINMVFGIQRPDANTVTGQIKSNVSGRVCGYFKDTAPSMIVLNNTSATTLDSQMKGRFMFQDGNDTLEMQAYYQDEAALIDSVITARTKKYSGPEEADEPAPPPEKRKPQATEVVLDTNFEEGLM